MRRSTGTHTAPPKATPSKATSPKLSLPPLAPPKDSTTNQVSTPNGQFSPVPAFHQTTATPTASPAVTQTSLFTPLKQQSHIQFNNNIRSSPQASLTPYKIPNYSPNSTTINNTNQLPLPLAQGFAPPIQVNISERYWTCNSCGRKGFTPEKDNQSPFQYDNSRNLTCSTCKQKAWRICRVCNWKIPVSRSVKEYQDHLEVCLSKGSQQATKNNSSLF